MIYGKPKLITEWIGELLNNYAEFKKKGMHYRCKICGIENDKKTGKDKILVNMSSVKSQIPISYFPDELVCNDLMLCEFSQTDVRAITFYALKNSKLKPNIYPANLYKIITQEFLDGKTIYTYKKIDANGEYRISAQELYTKTDLLKQFDFDDVLNIIHAAVQEQTIDDLS